MADKSHRFITVTPVATEGLIGFETDIFGYITRQVASLQDQMVREQLIAAGWTPPACRVPPAGWRCTRSAGHEGPCAAVEAAAPAPSAAAAGRGIYVASRASLPSRPAMWRELRALGWPIVSTWIDEAGPGETANLGQLWRRIEAEVLSASGLVLHVEPDDFPLKGALIEVGMALAHGKRVGVYAPGVELEPRSMRPLGSWAMHPQVCICATLAAARKWAESTPAAAPVAQATPATPQAAPADWIAIQEAWEAAGGNPGIKATRAELLEALKQLDQVCDEAAPPVAVEAPWVEVAPWGDCKVAFDVQDDDALWHAVDSGALQLPEGWKLVETDGAGARTVAIFRVKTPLTTRDGKSVRDAIARIDRAAARAAQAQADQPAPIGELSESSAASSHRTRADAPRPRRLPQKK